MQRPTDGFRLLVFDWDGTLLDSIGSIVACTRATLDELEMAPVDDATIRGAIGLGLRETVDRFSPGCDDATFARVIEVYRRHWFATWAERADPFAGVEEMLTALRGRGYRLAVATAKGRKGLEREFAKTGFKRFFAASRTLDEAPSKPAPAMLLGILEELGAAPGESLMVGDSVHDLQMAANASVAGLGVATGAQPREALLAAGAIDCLDAVTELPAWLAARAAGSD